MPVPSCMSLCEQLYICRLVSYSDCNQKVVPLMDAYLGYHTLDMGTLPLVVRLKTKVLDHSRVDKNLITLNKQTYLAKYLRSNSSLCLLKTALQIQVLNIYLK